MKRIITLITVVLVLFFSGCSNNSIFGDKEIESIEKKAKARAGYVQKPERVRAHELVNGDIVRIAFFDDYMQEPNNYLNGDTRNGTVKLDSRDHSGTYWIVHKNGNKLKFECKANGSGLFLNGHTNSLAVNLKSKYHSGTDWYAENEYLNCKEPFYWQRFMDKPPEPVGRCRMLNAWKNDGHLELYYNARYIPSGAKISFFKVYNKNC